MARLFFCGDIINQFSNEQFIGEKLISCIKACDFAVCNLEGAISSGDFKNKGMLQTHSTAKFLEEAGFNLCLLANNHITDYGLEGFVNTTRQLSFHNLSYMGAGVGASSVYEPFVKTIAGVTVGFVNVCEAQVGQFDSLDCDYGYAWLGWPDLDKIIRDTRKQVDVLFVCVHAGLEHYELPLKEFRNMYRRYCDLGADYVIGSHPHIAQGCEKYGNSTIFYSLGNFFFPRSKDAGKSDYENYSFSVIIDTESKDHELVYHSMENQMVELDDVKDTKVEIERLNDIISPEKYKALIREQNDRAYKNLVFKLFQNALNGQEPDDSFSRKIKNTIKYFFKRVNYSNTEERKTYRRKLLQRLVENETYRYLTIDVLKNKNNE